MTRLRMVLACQDLVTPMGDAGNLLALQARAGAHLLAVNAGFQVMLDTFVDEQSRTHPGLGLIPGAATRATFVEGAYAGRSLLPATLPSVSGFEAHWGRVALGASADPLTRVLLGTGNDGRTEGYAGDRTFATFIHGPVLGRNSALADHLLDRLLGTAVPPPADALWAERAREARTTEDLLDPTGWGGERYGRSLPVYSRLRPKRRPTG